MAVLTAVCVNVTNDVVFVVVDGDMATNPVLLVDSVVDAVLIDAEDRRIVFITVFDDVLVYIFEIFTNGEPNLSIAPTDECHDRRFV